MSRVTVWKSDADGKLFEDVKKYQAHLRKLATQRRHERKMAQVAAQRTEFVQQMCQQVKSFKELEQWIKDHWDWFFYNAIERESWHLANPKAIGKHEYFDVSFHSIHWSDSLSNSHSCPMTGETNWGSKKANAPRGYPGWHCRINIRVKTPKKGKYWTDGFGSSYFDQTPIHTGTGGGGGVNELGVTGYSYDCDIWADDFVAMTAEREKFQAWETIGGQPARIVAPEYA